jgi:hypothetical protein
MSPTTDELRAAAEVLWMRLLEELEELWGDRVLL